MIDSRKLSSYKDFKKVQGQNPSYWKEKRWVYHMVVMDLLKRIPDEIKSSLELGSSSFKLIKKSLTLGNRGKVDIKHDLKVVPLPFSNKEFDVAIALQVWEHIAKDNPVMQRRAFKELMRISNHVILSFPYLWKDVEKSNCHYMIDKDKIASWTCGIAPKEVVQVDNRIIYYWGP